MKTIRTILILALLVAAFPISAQERGILPHLPFGRQHAFPLIDEYGRDARRQFRPRYRQFGWRP